MLSIFDGLRDITLASVAFRLILSTLCGGIVGMEREFKRRSAGFRTHILICLGAAMTTLTSEFWLVYMRYYLDAARLGAGVVAGMGFIGAGTIIVTRRQRVKGLTTAAGLWTVAVVGLAIGAGFYEGGLLTTVLILLAEMLFSKLEYHIMATAPEINLFISPHRDRWRKIATGQGGYIRLPVGIRTRWLKVEVIAPRDSTFDAITFHIDLK